MRIPLAVTAGGAIGASARYLLVGGLGSFTTVSAFSLDAVVLFERGAGGLAGLYLAASVTLSLAGIHAGMRLLRLVLS